MSRVGYAYQGKEEKTVRCQGSGLRISPKESYEIANTLRGMNVVKAKKLLERVIELKEPIQYRKFNRGSGAGHRKGHKGPGRFPVNSSREFISLLNLLQANAKFKGMDSEKLSLFHIATHKGAEIRHSFKGSAHNSTTTHVEIVAKEEK